MTPEIQFLINCCKARPTAFYIKQIRTHITQLNTQQLSEMTALAHTHAIFPLVYHAIQTHASDLLSDANLAELKQQNMTIVMQNMQMTAELTHIIRLLEEKGIEALAFKGPALAQMAYGDITLRQYVDLDIFIHKKNIVQVADLLAINHYNPRVELKYVSNEAFLDVNSDCQFYQKTQSILLEVHWTVFRNAYSSKMKNINLWNNTCKVKLQNTTINTFNEETLLLYLCMHGSKHIWKRIEWITDIDRLITALPNLRWDDIYSMAETVDGKTMLNLGLSLASQFFNTPLPDHIRNNFKNTRILKLSADITTLLNEQDYFVDNELQKNYRHLLFHLSLRDNVQNKVDFLLKTFVPLKSSDIESVNLPKQLYLLYYFIRPLRLLNKYIQKLLH